MAFREGYQKQVQLLVRALPGVAEEKDFALKWPASFLRAGTNLSRLPV